MLIPEIMLLVAACVATLLGLSAMDAVRKLTQVVGGLACRRRVWCVAPRRSCRRTRGLQPQHPLQAQLHHDAGLRHRLALRAGRLGYALQDRSRRSPIPTTAASFSA